MEGDVVDGLEQSIDLTDHDHGHDDEVDHSVSILDGFSEVNPSFKQKWGERKGWGRVYNLQVGAHSYVVDEQYVKGCGKVPFTDWRPARMSKVLNEDGDTVAYMRQTLKHAPGHFLNTIGCGWEGAYIEITDERYHNNHKLALGLALLDVWQQHEGKNRDKLVRQKTALDNYDSI